MARKPEKPPTSKTPAIDPGTIRELAKLLDETGLTEIEIEANGASIRVARNAGFAAPRGRQLIWVQRHQLPCGGGGASFGVDPSAGPDDAIYSTPLMLRWIAR